MLHLYRLRVPHTHMLCYVQGLGQARWSISKGVVTAYKVMKIDDFGLIYVSIVQGLGQARWSIPKGVVTAYKVMKIADFGQGLLIVGI